MKNPRVRRRKEILKIRGSGKECDYNTRDLDSIPGSGRFPGEGNSNPLLYSCLVNFMEEPVKLESMESKKSQEHNLATKQ